MTEELIAEYDGLEIIKLTTPATGHVEYCITGPTITTVHLSIHDYYRLTRAVMKAEDDHIRMAGFEEAEQ